jgi:shikimate kinase
VDWRRILLVGFMGSGKSTVGRVVAQDLGWEFRDFDEVIERRVGTGIPQIFQEFGEPAFRALEARVAVELLALERVVLASGGGWPCVPGRLEGLDPSTLSIWLRVSPAAAVRRVRHQGLRRPLLTGPDSQARARRLLEEREPFYRLARWSVDTGSGSAAEVSERIVRRLAEDPAEPLRE